MAPPFARLAATLAVCLLATGCARSTGTEPTPAPAEPASAAPDWTCTDSGRAATDQVLGVLPDLIPTADDVELFDDCTDGQDGLTILFTMPPPLETARASLGEVKECEDATATKDGDGADHWASFTCTIKGHSVNIDLVYQDGNESIEGQASVDQP